MEQAEPTPAKEEVTNWEKDLADENEKEAVEEAEEKKAMDLKKTLTKKEVEDWENKLEEPQSVLETEQSEV